MCCMWVVMVRFGCLRMVVCFVIVGVRGGWNGRWWLVLNRVIW